MIKFTKPQWGKSSTHSAQSPHSPVPGSTAALRHNWQIPVGVSAALRSACSASRRRMRSFASIPPRYTVTGTKPNVFGAVMICCLHRLHRASQIVLDVPPSFALLDHFRTREKFARWAATRRLRSMFAAVTRCTSTDDRLVFPRASLDQQPLNCRIDVRLRPAARMTRFTGSKRVQATVMPPSSWHGEWDAR